MNGHNSPLVLKGSIKILRCNDSPCDIPLNKKRLHKRISTNNLRIQKHDETQRYQEPLINLFLQFIVSQTNGRALSKQSDTDP